jgi:Tfp pilus assembly major pilin PilA
MNSPVSGSPESLYSAAIGPRADFYLPRFLAFEQPQAPRTSWNWAAFFVSFYWFLYRRMWREWAVYALLIPLLIALAVVLLPRQGSLVVVAQLLSLAYSFVVIPLFANYLYYGSIKRRIADVQARVPEPVNQVSVLAALPHTSGLAWALALLVPLAGILAAIAIPAYQDYAVRAQVASSLNQVADLKVAIAQKYAATHAWPASAAEATAASPSFPAADVTVEAGTISIHYGGTAALAIAQETLSLRPGVDASGGVVWTCGYAAQAGSDPTGGGAGANRTSLKPRYLPRDCRQ